LAERERFGLSGWSRSWVEADGTENADRFLAARTGLLERAGRSLEASLARSRRDTRSTSVGPIPRRHTAERIDQEIDHCAYLCTQVPTTRIQSEYVDVRQAILRQYLNELAGA
jgi:hypothetical protein